MLLGTVRYCSVLLGAARYCSVLLGAARCCSMLLGAALRCLVAIKHGVQVLKLPHSQSSRGIDFSRIILQISEVHCWYSLSEANIQLKYFECKHRRTLGLKEGKIKTILGFRQESMKSLNHALLFVSLHKGNSPL